MALSQDWERSGIHDLFTVSENARSMLPSLCKTLTKCNKGDKDVADLIQTVCQLGQSAYYILNKRAITKYLLQEYADQKNLPVNGATKTDVIEGIVSYWKAQYSAANVPTEPTTPKIVINIVNNHNTVVHQLPQAVPSPLQIMAEEFTSWLFNKVNESSLIQSDMWNDVTGAIRLVDSEGCTQDLQAEGSEGVLQTFQQLTGDFQFQLTPNICPAGVQGKMNAYGMVMIASCGTVYRGHQFVGVFEAGFGLLRDPSMQDNWKLKHSKLQVKSVAGSVSLPRLEDCESLKEILALPEPDEGQCTSIKSNSQ